MFIIGDREAAEHLHGIGIKAQNVEPAMLEIVRQLQRIAGISMTAQGRRGGGSWQHLKPDTIRRKAKRGLDPRTEFATHALYNSLSGQTADSIVEISGDSLKFGSRLPYTKAQMFGWPPKNLPARPLITIVEGDRKKMGKTILDHIVR